MALRVYRPPLPLSQYVEFMWRATGSGLQPSRQRIYPDGSMALVIHLRRESTCFFIDDQACSVRVPLLAGPWSRSFQIDPSQSSPAIGVVFRPGAARMFFPVAAHELHNIDITLCDLDRGDANRLLNDVCSAVGIDAEFRALERYLHMKLAEARPLHPAIRYAVDQLSREGVSASIQRIQTDTGLSHTRFIHLFREHVGLTPKLFGRVRRFRALLQRIEKGVPVNWAELAADCGYFDQAHLIHDFRAFAAITPRDYSRMASGDVSSLITAAVKS
ncbi:AraC family transcriptional regulator [Occallatibacter riparius]|uniref:Helix-turn-helix domain-containing protein n=1 Tax=Occallatibacter riparius TaxID=1002689 RepID=A0A9J7BI44_9BACT|nr:helix-turn-helix domain-containing protein [Occallatibacter riparius]UWZ82472.1 helix-turn-helix domain-containing protein [Occallatibacter riparius]